MESHILHIVDDVGRPHARRADMHVHGICWRHDGPVGVNSLAVTKAWDPLRRTSGRFSWKTMGSRSLAIGVESETRAQALCFVEYGPLLRTGRGEGRRKAHLRGSGLACPVWSCKIFAFVFFWTPSFHWAGMDSLVERAPRFVFTVRNATVHWNNRM